MKLLRILMALAALMPLCSRAQWFDDWDEPRRYGYDDRHMIYIELSKSRADTIAIDMSSTCAQYQGIVMTDPQTGRWRRFTKMQQAINHLAKYGWRVQSQTNDRVLMQQPYDFFIVNGQEGVKQIFDMIDVMQRALQQGLQQQQGN